MPKTNYSVTLEVKKLLPDGEYLCFQKVYPIVDGKKFMEDLNYRFIRCLPTGAYKSQRGQAQTPQLKDMEELIEAMKKKESPTVL